MPISRVESGSGPATSSTEYHWSDVGAAVGQSDMRIVPPPGDDESPASVHERMGTQQAQSEPC